MPILFYITVYNYFFKMEVRELSKDEIIGLIAEFKSEVRKSLAKLDIYNEKIEELTRLLGENPVNFIQKNADKTRKPYPLSKWDNIVLDVIKENGKPTTSKEIYEKGIEKANAMGIMMDEAKMRSKINQCLVKLANRRDDIKKVKYGGRGFAYSLKD